MRYEIIEEQAAYVHWLHNVEADSKEQAIKKVENGESTPDSHKIFGNVGHFDNKVYRCSLIEETPAEMITRMYVDGWTPEQLRQNVYEDILEISEDCQDSNLSNFWDLTEPQRHSVKTRFPDFDTGEN